MSRRPLPLRRPAETFNLRFGNQNFTVSIGLFPDGAPAETFVDVAKSGSDLAAIARDAAILLSLALQHGTLITTVQRAVTRDGRGEPASIIGAVVDCISAGAR